jgi:hypothetical protein
MLGTLLWNGGQGVLQDRAQSINGGHGHLFLGLIKLRQF